jgi:lipoyl(octanoyl) transferase
VTAPAPFVRHLGRRDYGETFDAMREFVTDRAADEADEIWLLEHDPVFTQGQNGQAEHVLGAGDIPVVQVDRGGQVTYHGPGQLVIYPLIYLPRLGLGVRTLVVALENSVIDLLARYGHEAVARRDAPGVYVDGAKVASIGLRIRKDWCYHGMAVNVAMDLEPFSRINPCGFAGLSMNQLRDLGGPSSVATAAQELLPMLLARLGYNSELIDDTITQESTA